MRKKTLEDPPVMGTKESISLLQRKDDGKSEIAGKVS